MYLAADIGNSRLKLAVFEADKVVLHQVVPKEDALESIKSVLMRYNILAAILSNTSVVHRDLLMALQAIPYFIHLNMDTPVPIINDYTAPGTLGKDRLAAAVGASKIFPGQAILFFDMGTCITMNFVDKNGHFIGGNISPGIKMRLQAMHAFTDRLPLVETDLPSELIGRDTVSALQNGGVKGALREMETFIKEIKAVFGEILIILTGGDAYLFENYTKNKIFVAPNLVLQGLNEILKYNVNKN